jgi:hypothetical protein
MGWIEIKSFWLSLPALTDVFVRGKSSEGFEPLGEVIGYQKSVEMLFQVLIGPGMIGFGQPVCNGVFIADPCKMVMSRSVSMPTNPSPPHTGPGLTSSPFTV